MSAIGLGIFVVVVMSVAGIFVDAGSIGGVAVLAVVFTVAVGAWCALMWGQK